MARRRFIIDIDEETNKKKLVVSDIILLLIFGSLIALIVVLLLTAKKEKEDPVNTYSDLVVPIIEEKSKNEFTVDLSAIKNKEYTVKITNYYKEEKPIDHEISYTFEVINSKEISIELYKNDLEKDLMASLDDVSLERNILKANKKQEDLYKIVVTSEEKLTDKDTIKILITS